jgi:hypothetical protein
MGTYSIVAASPLPNIASKTHKQSPTLKKSRIPPLPPRTNVYENLRRTIYLMEKRVKL